MESSMANGVRLLDHRPRVLFKRFKDAHALPFCSAVARLAEVDTRGGMDPFLIFLVERQQQRKRLAMSVQPRRPLSHRVES